MKSFVLQMFKAIDAKDHDALPEFFTPDIVYKRPGFDAIEGAEDLRDFYQNRRIIQSGKHHVESVVNSGEEAVTVGRFVGVLKDGSDVNEPFADVYKFHDGKIAQRTTYFYRAAI